MSQLIKTSTAKAVEVLAFHRDAFNIARTGHKAGETMAKKMEALLTSRYGSTSPTFEQYRADRKALQQLAKEKGLESDQWVRKPFCAAIVKLYGKLPESQSPEALRKAAEREIAKKAIEAARQSSQSPAVKPGAPAGETQDRQPSEAEQIEALVTRIGLFRTLDACIRILAADEKTAAQAAHLAKMAKKAAELTATATA